MAARSAPPTPTPNAAALWAGFRQLSFDLAADPPPTTAPPDYRIGLLLREAGRWDGVSRLVIFDPPRLWTAMHRGDLTLDDLTEGTHYRIVGGAP